MCKCLCCHTWLFKELNLKSFSHLLCWTLRVKQAVSGVRGVKWDEQQELIRKKWQGRDNKGHSSTLMVQRVKLFVCAVVYMCVRPWERQTVPGNCTWHAVWLTVCVSVIAPAVVFPHTSMLITWVRTVGHPYHLDALAHDPPSHAKTDKSPSRFPDPASPNSHYVSLHGSLKFPRFSGLPDRGDIY